jgi:hypothetical protein
VARYDINAGSVAYALEKCILLPQSTCAPCATGWVPRSLRGSMAHQQESPSQPSALERDEHIPDERLQTSDQREVSGQENELSTSTGRVPTSCVKSFDSLYYCYSPFHQAKIYYQSGELDSCRGRLKRFQMCAMSRFRAQSESEVRGTCSAASPLEWANSTSEAATTDLLNTSFYPLLRCRTVCEAPVRGGGESRNPESTTRVGTPSGIHCKHFSRR